MIINHQTFSNNEECNLIIALIINAQIFYGMLITFYVCNHSKEHRKCVKALWNNMVTDTVKWFRNTKRYRHIYKYTALLDIKVNTTYTNHLSIYMKKLYQFDLIISEESYQTLNHNSLTELSQDT